jgi:hypothetical protein
MERRKRDVDGQTHHPPKTVEQQSEDSFPASDPPSFNSGQAIGAPEERETEPLKPDSKRVLEAEKKVKSGKAARKKHY